MCEKCTATEGTFREVGRTHWRRRHPILGAPGDLIYVVRAGDCLATPSDDAPFSVEELQRSCSEILTPNRLSYPLAKWVLDHTSPIPDTGEQNV